MNAFTIQNFRAALGAKTDKDERRIKLFVAAVQLKAIELAVSDSTGALSFAQGSAALLSRWALKAKKLSFADLFRDPFKELREDTRYFAREWQMDPVLLEELG